MTPSRFTRSSVAVALVVLAGAGGPPARATQPEARPAAAPSTWQVVGRQGLIHVVIVPLGQAADRAAYQQQVPLICGPAPTCFVNFYSNSRNVPVALPLPDEVTQEATAILRRSDKQQTEGFRMSCRLKLPEPDCF